MRQTPIEFRNKALSVEGILTLPQGSAPPFPAVIICHPHPFFAGSMDNQVVKTISQALDGEAMATLRFNFRGVGNSQGTFSNGPDEQQDLAAALNVLKKWPGIDSERIGLAGYSFGASVILGGLPKYKAVKALALISPPISAVKRSSLKKDKRSKLFLVGEKDRLVPPSQLREAVATIQLPVEFHMIPGANHTLGGHDSTVAIRVAEFFVKALN